MNDIEEYAINLVAQGGESIAEDDLDEDGVFDEARETDWRVSTELGVRMARAIEQNKASFLAWFMSIERAEVAHAIGLNIVFVPRANACPSCGREQP